LKIAGISSTKLGDANEGMLKNQHLYNDKELWEEADLNWYDYGFRNYDPQIGRFPQLDPLTWDYPELTNYQYGSNDPIMNIDIDGLEGGAATVATYSSQAALDAALAASLKVVHNAGEVVVKAAPKLASTSAAGIGAKLTRALIVNAAKITADVANYFTEKKNIIENNASIRYDRLKEFANEKIENAKNNLKPGSVFREWLWEELKSGLDPMEASMGVGGRIGRKGLDIAFKIEKAAEKEIIILKKYKIPRDQLNPPKKPGNAPTFKKDNRSVEIHHENQNPNGPFREIHPDDHRKIANPIKKSKINRQKFKRQRENYWKKEFPD